ncbi:hypothetical protein GCM10027317_13910 [Massilia agri]
MRVENARPQFGGRLKSPEYYEQVNSICRVLREYSTLRTIADALNSQHFTTPAGMEWNRHRLSAYLKTNDINKGN